MKRLLFLFCMMAVTLSQAKKWDATYISKLIAKGGIDKVIQYYHDRYYGPNRDPQDAFRIAELYVKKKDYPAAMEWYKKEEQLINTSRINLFNYANTCRLVGEYQKALDAYLLYAAQTGEVDKVIDLANQCEKVLKASVLADNYKLENYSYNTSADEGSLAVLRNNPVYISEQQASGKAGKPLYTPYQIVREYQNFLPPVPVLSPSAPIANITGMSFTRDGNTVAYAVHDGTNSKKKGQKETEKIYLADNLGGQFLHSKPFPFNSDTYSLSHPAFNSDGTVLYFSSNMPGGFGGYDIWQSSLLNAKWSKPVNLGALLNTKANELNPFLVQDQKDNTLYFSSDRDGGYGGYDIYAGERIDGVWQGVEMQAAPINSAGDDRSMIYDEEINTGYVASDRPGGKGGFDIYRFTPFNLRMIISAKDSATQKPLDYALVQLSYQGEKINEGVTNDSGIAIFQIGKDKSFELDVSKDNYRPLSLVLNSMGKGSGDSVCAQALLKQDAHFSIANGATNNLSLGNYIIFTGQVRDAASGKPLRAVKMRMVNYTTQKMRELDLDKDGRFQIKLLLNNSYKVIFETPENKVTDELTTFGMDRLNIKVRDYSLAGSKLKIGENRVFTQDDLPSYIHLVKDDTGAPSGNVVSKSEVDSLVKHIAADKAALTATRSAPLPAPTSKAVKSDSTSAGTLQKKTEGKMAASKLKAEAVQKQIGDTLKTSGESLLKPESAKAPVVSAEEHGSKNETTAHPEVYYKIQLGSYPEANLSFPEFSQYGKTEVVPSYGQYVYRLGDFSNQEETKKLLDKVRQGGYYGAFILQYKDGKVSGIVK